MDTPLTCHCDKAAIAAADCAAIAADLDRLAALVGAAGAELMESFALLAAPTTPAQARAAQARAVSALQFEDIFLQLIAHARARLARIEAAQPGGSEPIHHPVPQSDMAAGAVELF